MHMSDTLWHLLLAGFAAILSFFSSAVVGLQAGQSADFVLVGLQVTQNRVENKKSGQDTGPACPPTSLCLSALLSTGHMRRGFKLKAFQRFVQRFESSKSSRQWLWQLEFDLPFWLWVSWVGRTAIEDGFKENEGHCATAEFTSKPSAGFKQSALSEAQRILGLWIKEIKMKCVASNRTMLCMCLGCSPKETWACTMIQITKL